MWTAPARPSPPTWAARARGEGRGAYIGGPAGRALAEQIQPCDVCRPDTELGLLDVYVARLFRTDAEVAFFARARR